MWFLYGLLGAVAVFLAVLLIRAACFQPKAQPSTEAEEISIDREAAVDALQQLIRCKTVSNADPELEDDAEFEKLISLLPKLYPQVFAVCSFERLPERGLLMRWPGQDSKHPSVMMAHYDVVPADESQWDKPAFEGILENGVLWGRGTLDTKATFNGILCAANQLIREGFRPENDIYFAFSGSEEINGNGAKHIVSRFMEQGIRPALVLDEGGAVVEKVFPGVKAPCGLIGIAEKGMMNVEYSVRSGGGHASAPPVDTPVRTLSEVCLRVLKHPFKMRINRPAAELFDTLGRHSTFFYRIIFANLRCFRPVLDLICRLGGGELNALVRTTTAFTQMEGSNARNVLPTRACLVSNMRLNPGDTVTDARRYLEKVVANDNVEIRVLEGFDPSPVSVTDCEAYRTLASVVAQTWPGCIISPYLMVQCSDARHYAPLSDRVYRFCAMELSAEERKTIHGNNERIRLDAICKTVEFYIRLLRTR
jgi:carboxypeptidase PM20D1